MLFSSKLSETAYKYFGISSDSFDPNATTDILVDRWEAGYEKGMADQKVEDADVLERATTDAYVEGYDRGFDKGEAARIETRNALEVAGKTPKQEGDKDV